ncbi:NADH-quinone oxidoreductase subunit C [Streptomyces collinus]|uniref:NADH-quinone oxidoreductase subunit C n=1 Tax=Streptomyces collinus TaxID=42684 RepID=UPI003322DB08
MSTAGWLPAPAEELFGPEATAEEAYEVLTVDVPPSAWLTALETARTTLSCTYFDWLSAVDEPGTGFRVSAHVVALSPVRRLLLRTTVPHEAPALPSAVGVYAGAAWHERETHEMFGVDFENHPGLDHLLLPDTFEGHPLRKDFVLAARVAKAWPGAKEPGESDHGGPKRRQMLPPGVPDPNEWGPLKGTLPAAPARPARAAGERPARAAGERPVRRTRTASAGSASQTAEPATAPGAAETPSGTATGPAAGPAAARPRRTRSASEGSASQAAGPGEAGAASGAAAESASGAVAGPAGAAGAAGRPRRSRSASEGSASQTAPGDDAADRKQAAAEGDASRAAAETPEVEGPAAEASVAHEPTSAPAPTPAGPRRARSASGGSASQRAATEEPAGTEPAGSEPAGSEPAGTEPSGPGDGPGRPARRSTAPRSSDAPWHHARPAFDEEREPERAQSPEPRPETARPEAPEPRPEPEAPQPEAEAPQPEAEAPQSETPEVPEAAQAPRAPEDRAPADRDTPEDPTGGPQ